MAYEKYTFCRKNYKKIQKWGMYMQCVDRERLYIKIRMQGQTLTNAAKQLGIGRAAFSMKMNSKGEFKRNEIAKLIEEYCLTADEVMEIFFGGVRR